MLAWLWQRLSNGGPGVTVSGRALRRFTDPEVDRLLRSRVLIEQPRTDLWPVCGHCDCGLDARPIREVQGQLQACCPYDPAEDEALEPDDLRRFRIDADRVANAIATAGGLGPAECIGLGFWLLGTDPSGRAIVLARESGSLAAPGTAPLIRSAAACPVIVILTDEVIRHWREKAGDRPTVAFCSTVAHAESVAAAFREAGIAAAVVHGDLDGATRRSILAAYASGAIRVVVNVAVLTEGWDHPPTSCVVLLRPSSYKSTMIQMVGRGLRAVDPAEHPGVVKTDCIVLDFGTSSQRHGTLEQDVDLDGHTPTGEAPTKICPACAAEIPLAARECPLCGEVLVEPEDESRSQEASNGSLAGFVMSEIDLLERSSFAWEDLFGDDAALMASGFNAWGGTFYLDGHWYAVGGAKGQAPRLLGVGERTVCLAQADDWLNTYETDESAFKSKRWLRQAPTEKQLQYLAPQQRQDYGLTRYRASALITFRFNKQAIRRLVLAAEPDRMAA